MEKGPYHEQNEMARKESAEKAGSFSGALEELGIQPDDARVPLLKNIWNRALESSSKYFGDQEGTDYNLEKYLGVTPEKD
jgi:hypothetical protein